MKDLIKELENCPSFRKASVLQEISERGGKEYVKLYREYIKDRDWHVRLEAAKALERALGQESLDDLKPLLEDRAYGVREDVKKLLLKYQEL